MGMGQLISLGCTGETMEGEVDSARRGGWTGVRDAQPLSLHDHPGVSHASYLTSSRNAVRQRTHTAIDGECEEGRELTESACCLW